MLIRCRQRHCPAQPKEWEVMATLKGHQGTVVSLAWSYDSMYLSTAGIDGATSGWFMDGFARYAECVIIGSRYSCIVYDANRKYVYGCEPNIPLREVDTDKKYPNRIYSRKRSPLMTEAHQRRRMAIRAALVGSMTYSVPTFQRLHPCLGGANSCRKDHLLAYGREA